MGYKVSFREEIVRRVLSRNPGDTIKTISEEICVPTRTIRRWVTLYSENVKSKLTLQYQDKISAALETINIDFESKSRYCRAHGIYVEELEAWEEEVKEVLVDGVVSKTDYNNLRAEKNELARELRRKDEELKKKDKALSEAAMLLLVQKKPKICFWKRNKVSRKIEEQAY